MRSAVTEFCARIGADTKLVQGAGGNVSWKEGDALWIKASGTWLSDAADKCIFVPVDLAALRIAIASRNFAVYPKTHGKSDLRPSIETLLHALMPHRVVVHVHAVEILSHLVRHDFQAEFGERLDKNLQWVSTGYCKPGDKLAEAVNTAISYSGEVDVVFLKNHGVVIGGPDVMAVDRILQNLVAALALPQRVPGPMSPQTGPLILNGRTHYFPVGDAAVHQLATDPVLFDRLSSDWALYPDHVVFLGREPFCYDSVDAVHEDSLRKEVMPELIFIRGAGVFTHMNIGMGKQAQLRCYYDVLSRQPDEMNIDSLSEREVDELLNWDLEQYRIGVGDSRQP